MSDPHESCQAKFSQGRTWEDDKLKSSNFTDSLQFFKRRRFCTPRNPLYPPFRPLPSALTQSDWKPCELTELYQGAAATSV
ncbi:hypothetical protein SDJN03_18168, partial [Cucurbita argyrosperma subsp. sororia]